MAVKKVVYGAVSFRIGDGILGTRDMCKGDALEVLEELLDSVVDGENVGVLDGEDAI